MAVANPIGPPAAEATQWVNSAFGASVPKTFGVEFTHCPYDASPIESEASVGGSTLLFCTTCGATWEWYRTWLRRLREPDRDAVRAARAGRTPAAVVDRGRPQPQFVATMWRHVRSSSSHSSNTRPPTS